MINEIHVSGRLRMAWWDSAIIQTEEEPNKKGKGSRREDIDAKAKEMRHKEENSKLTDKLPIRSTSIR